MNTNVSGTMEGKVKKFRGIDNVEIDSFDFEATSLGRHEHNGLTAYGEMAKKDEPHRSTVHVIFVDKNQTSGSFNAHDPRIKSLIFIYGLAIPTYKALEGTVTLQNHAPGKVSINGSLEFKTEIKGGHYFVVAVNYAIDGMGDSDIKA